MKKLIKIGLAGCGWIAEQVYLPLLHNIEGFLVNAIYDISEERLSYLGDKFGIKAQYVELQAFLASDIDAVIIATPNYTHKNITIEAASHKKHILCEKPLAFTVSDYDEILKAVKEHEVIYIPGFVNRFRQDIQVMNMLLDNNYIGRIKAVEAGWIRGKGIPRYGSWFTMKEKSGGGVLFDLGSHVLDICSMHLADKKIVKTSMRSIYDSTDECGQAIWYSRESQPSGRMDVEDTAFCTVEFEENLKLQTVFSWNSNHSGDITYFKWIGEEGELVLNTLFGYSTQRINQENSLYLKSKEFDNMSILIVPGRQTQDNAFKNILIYFKNCIQTKSLGDLNIVSAYGSVKLIESLYKTECQVEKSFKKDMLMRDVFEKD